MEVLAESLLKFWLGELDEAGMVSAETSKKWFVKDELLDKSIARIYGSYLDTAGMGGMDRWAADPKALTALIILLDQFPRNIYRGLEKAYIYDKKALALSKHSIEKELYKTLPSMYAFFHFLPLMHSESLEDQDLCIEKLKELQENSEPSVRDFLAASIDSAHKHREIIARFGRFPHRNKALYRESTKEEVEFLTLPGSSF